MASPLLTPKLRKIGIDFRKYLACAKRYGDKAAGLAMLPPAWTPPFVGIPINVHEMWKSQNKVDLSAYQGELTDWLETFARDSPLLLRSSGAGESLKDRGSLLTLRLEKGASLSTIAEAAAKIFEHAAKSFSGKSVGLVLQVAIKAEATGHLSNETSVTPTRNQWKYETEQPNWSPPQGLNSKFAPLPDATGPLRGRRPTPHDALRSLGQWVNQSVEPRSHLEWVLSDGKLWIVQLDLEWRQRDSGIDPDLAALRSSDDASVPDHAASKVFTLYNPGDDTPSKKLANLNDFDFSVEHPAPALYYAYASSIRDVLLHSGRDALITEIDELTGGKCVIRTDLIEAQSGFNLPRTETINGSKAVQWLQERLEDFSDNGVSPDKIIFVMHSFLPAQAAAWVYADPGQPLVHVDSLWGLPDGLQFLPHDSFQVDHIRNAVVAKKIRYKPRFLMENADGSWKYVDVLVSKGRRTSLVDADVLDIAIRTSRIAEKLGGAAQIMWFCGIPARYGHGRNIPWFRAREFADPAPRHELKHKPFAVHSEADLERLPTSPHTIGLMPDAPLVRDDKFLDAVIAHALRHRCAVALQGSLLGHTFYKLSAAGIAVVLHDPVQHYRKRGRRTFGKLVRDNIPAGIVSGGEIVREAVLDHRDLMAGLAAKLCEESVELSMAKDYPAKAEELSDISELMSALSEASGISLGEIEDRARKKREKRGGFTERRVLLETSLPMPGATSTTVPVVALKDIAQVAVHDNGVFIPFAALFADAAGVALDLRSLIANDRIKIKLVQGGLRLERFADGDRSHLKQLDMFDIAPQRAGRNRK